MKRFKRLLYLIAIGLIVLLAVSFSGVYLYHGTPSWYQPQVATTQQTRDAANRADQKILDLFSWAASAQAQERRHQLGKSIAGEVPIGPKSVSFDEDEINSFIATWKSSEPSDLEQRLSRYFTDVRVVFEDDSVILAGQSPEFEALVSAEFSPSIDDQGKLHLDLSSLSAGRLPIPKSMVAGKMQRLQAILQEQMRLNQANANIDPTYTANRPAMAASWIGHLLAAMNEQASEPIIIVPFDMAHLDRGLLVKLMGVHVSEGSLTLTMEAATEQDAKTLGANFTNSAGLPAN